MLRNAKTNAGRHGDDPLEIYLFVEAGRRFLDVSVNEFCKRHYKSFDKISRRPTDEAALIRGRVSKNESLRRRFYESKEKLHYYAGLELPGVRVNLPSPNGRDRLEALVAERVALLERQGAARK
jgi:hypothetical protein